MALSVPPEGLYTEAEIRFIQNSPPGLWPDNQDSYFGQVRKTVTDVSQELRDILLALYINMSPETADVYLDRWEVMVGLPANPAGKNLARRRADVLARLKRGAFQRWKRDRLINDFIVASVQGSPATFTPEGIDFTGGIPLYNENISNLAVAFRVYEWVQNFTYLVKIASGYVVDIPGLQRQLEWLTPAGISFTIDDTDAYPLDYKGLMKHLEPRAYWPMIETSGTAVTDLIFNRSPGIYVNTPSLNNTFLAMHSYGKNPLFNGTDEYVTVAHTTELDVDNTFSIAAWVRPDNVPGFVADFGTNAPQLMIDDSGMVILAHNGEPVAGSSDTVEVADISMIGVQRNAEGETRFWINGIDAGVQNFIDVTFATVSTNATLMSNLDQSILLEGVGGHVALFARELLDSEWVDIWNHGKGFALVGGMLFYPGSPDAVPGLLIPAP